MSLFWVKNWKDNLLASINFQQLPASLKGFYSLLRDYVRDDKWCGGLCYPNGNLISPSEFAKVIKGKPYLIEQYFDELIKKGMVYKDKNKILCLRKYAVKVLMSDKKCEKCLQNKQGECVLIGDNPHLPLQLPCYNSATTPQQDCNDIATTPPDIPAQPIENKEVIISEKVIRREESKVNEDNKMDIVSAEADISLASSNNKHSKKEIWDKTKPIGKYNTHDLIGYFNYVFTNQFGIPYACNFGRDGKIFKELLNLYSDPTAIVNCIDAFFDDVKQGGWIGNKATIPILKAKINEYMIKYREGEVADIKGK